MWLWQAGSCARELPKGTHAKLFMKAKRKPTILGSPFFFLTLRRHGRLLLSISLCCSFPNQPEASRQAGCERLSHRPAKEVLEIVLAVRDPCHAAC